LNSLLLLPVRKAAKYEGEAQDDGEVQEEGEELDEGGRRHAEGRTWGCTALVVITELVRSMVGSALVGWDQWRSRSKQVLPECVASFVGCT